MLLCVAALSDFSTLHRLLPGLFLGYIAKVVLQGLLPAFLLLAAITVLHRLVRWGVHKYGSCQTRSEEQRRVFHW